MKMEEWSKKRYLLVPILMPGLLMTAYLVGSRTIGLPPAGMSDYAALVMSVGLGAVGLAMVLRKLEWHIMGQLAGLAVYCVIVFVGLMWYSLYFVCVVFRECL